MRATILTGSIILWSALAFAEDASRADRLLTGTIQRLDHEAGQLTLQTDLQKTLTFQSSRSDLLKDLSQGDRVIVELDDRGAPSKITRVTIPELPTPAVQ